LAPEDEPKFRATDNLFRCVVISALHSKYEKSYISIPSGKDLWDALEAKFGVFDAGSELYLMEQLFDYKMVENRSVVEQAHEIQALTKELELFPVFYLTSLWPTVSSLSYHLLGRILLPL
jgi:hypothetical protein